jgi:putative membrane protein
LDANIIQSRGISNSAMFTSNSSEGGLELNAPADQRNILDWVKAFNYSENPEEFRGQTADVIGFVYHDPRLPNHQFLVGRLTVTCCVADAFAIGMVVEWPQAAEMVENAWVHVRGEVQVVEVDGQRLPLIIAESIKETDSPPQPYLFP